MAWYNDYGGYPPYVPVSQKLATGRRMLQTLLDEGEVATPAIAKKGRRMADSFWGQSWCEQMELRSDSMGRLERGRTYARNGSVLHLRLKTGEIEAYVAGTDLYIVRVKITPLAQAHWKQLVERCAGQVASVVELLQGRLPKAALEAIADPKMKLFPGPNEMKFTCSCPDYGGMCKHIAAVLYGIGARLDDEPELFFTLRGVDWNELISTEVSTHQLQGKATKNALKSTDLSGLFGIELEGDAPAPAMKKPVGAKTKKAAASKPKKAARKKGPAAPKARSLPTITSSALRERGLSASTIQSWIRSGVLVRTELQGRYQTTAETASRIKAWSDQRKNKEKKARTSTSTRTRGARSKA